MATYNHVFSLNFTVSGLSSRDEDDFTHADKKQILKALKAAYIDQANLMDSRSTLSDAIETGWADVIEHDPVIIVGEEA